MSKKNTARWSGPRAIDPMSKGKLANKDGNHAIFVLCLCKKTDGCEGKRVVDICLIANNQKELYFLDTSKE